MKEQIKIRIFREHLCYLNRDLVLEFQNRFQIININAWIKEECFKDYNILLVDGASLSELKERVLEDYYDNVSDWLREKMRNKLLNRVYMERE